jgi:hypothetical protein
MEQFWKARNTRGGRLFGAACLVIWLVSACQNAAPPAPELPPTRTPMPPTRTAEPTASPAGTAALALGEPFTLEIGQERVLPEADLHLRFERVLDDSRCPRLVLCVWSGQARLLVSVWSRALTPETREFSTFSNPPNTTDTHTYQGFSIRLVTVDPYPDAPGTAISASAYRITLSITRHE